MSKIETRKTRECEICGATPKEGVLLINAYGMWLCGNHLIQAYQRFKSEQRNFIMEELNDNNRPRNKTKNSLR